MCESPLRRIQTTVFFTFISGNIGPVLQVAPSRTHGDFKAENRKFFQAFESGGIQKSCTNVEPFLAYCLG